LKAELERLRSLVPKPQSPASSSDEHSSSPKTREMSTAFRIRPLFEADKCVEVTAELVKIKKKKKKHPPTDPNKKKEYNKKKKMKKLSKKTPNCSRTICHKLEKIC